MDARQLNTQRFIFSIIKTAMSLTAARLHLRPVTPTGADELLRIYGNPVTQQRNPAGPQADGDAAQAVLTSWLSHWPWLRERGVRHLHGAERLPGFSGVAHRRYGALAVHTLGSQFARTAWGQE